MNLAVSAAEGRSARWIVATVVALAAAAPAVASPAPRVLATALTGQNATLGSAVGAAHAALGSCFAASIGGVSDDLAREEARALARHRPHAEASARRVLAAAGARERAAVAAATRWRSLEQAAHRSFDAAAAGAGRGDCTGALRAAARGTRQARSALEALESACTILRCGRSARELPELDPPPLVDGLVPSIVRAGDRLEIRGQFISSARAVVVGDLPVGHAPADAGGLTVTLPGGVATGAAVLVATPSGVARSTSTLRVIPAAGAGDYVFVDGIARSGAGGRVQLYVRSTPGGGVEGGFSLTERVPQGSEYAGVADCMRIEGNRVSVAGTLTQGPAEISRWQLVIQDEPDYVVLALLWGAPPSVGFRCDPPSPTLFPYVPGFDGVAVIHDE